MRHLCLVEASILKLKVFLACGWSTHHYAIPLANARNHVAQLRFKALFFSLINKNQPLPRNKTFGIDRANNEGLVTLPNASPPMACGVSVRE